jgi:two-component system nitrogen regulation response regulator GlnG
MSQENNKENTGAFHLSERLENDLRDFVRRIKHGHPKDLYSLLISEIEKTLFRFALQETGGNQVQAAELLGIHRNTLQKKIKALKIKVEKVKEPAAKSV